MKRLLQLLFIVLLPVIGLSQTSEEKQVIIEDYNKGYLEELSRSLQIKADNEKAEAKKLAKQNGWDIRYEKNGKLFELMKVTKDGYPVYYTTFNVNAAKSTRANTLHNGG